MFAKDDLIAALRLRYDHYSAQGMYDRARERAGLADKAELDAKDVRALRSALEASKDRVDGVLARIDEMLGSGGGAQSGGTKAEEPAKAKDGGKDKDKDKKADKADKSDKTEVKADEAKAEPAKTEPAKTEAKADAKPEGDKPAEASADKGGDKPAEKPADNAAGAE